MKQKIVDTLDRQKILTIREPLCYPVRAFGVDSDSEKTSVYHGLIRAIGIEMRKNNRNNFFHTSYPELVKAHTTGKQGDINRLCRKLQVDLRPYAARLAHNYHFTTIDLNDFIQEGLIAVVEYLPKYRYICPDCLERFERVEPYSNHCRKEHGYLMEPKPDIRSFLSGIIRGYMLNYLRHQFQLKRTPLAVVHASDFLESDKSPVFVDAINPSPETLVASKEAIERVRDCLDRERNEKIRVFIQRILEGANAREAYSGISQRGLAASAESARVTIYQLKQKTRAFAKYREVLAG